ncbi:MAG: DUF6220 domain-containing protein [Heyndrickxia sp.]
MDQKKYGSNGIRIIFAILSILFLIGLLVQVFLAGIAIFADIGNWSSHEIFVRFFEFIPVGMFLLSFFGKIPKMWKWQSASLYLMIILQYVTASLIGKVPYISALHPIIALLLFWRALVVVQESIKFIKNTRSE